MRLTSAGWTADRKWVPCYPTLA